MIQCDHAVGIDLVDVSRFEGLVDASKKHMLEKLFTQSEIQYASAFASAASHFAGMFAAKEAASKALGTDIYPTIELEVRHAEDGAPQIWNKNMRLPVSVSITHTSSAAAAVAIA